MHVDLHPAGNHLHRRLVAFHDDVLQGIVVPLEADGAHVLLGAEAIDGLIADETDAGEHFALLVGYDELSRLIADSTREKNGVSRVEDGDIGVGHGLALFVDEGARQVALGFVSTLHEVLVAISDDANGIEAYHFRQGIAEAEALETASDGEVLQVVIDEGYLMAFGGGVQVFQYTAERLVLITAGNLLGRCVASDGAQ